MKNGLGGVLPMRLQSGAPVHRKSSTSVLIRTSRCPPPRASTRAARARHSSHATLLRLTRSLSALALGPMRMGNLRNHATYRIHV